MLQDVPFASTWRLFSSGGGCYLGGTTAINPVTIHSDVKAARQSGQAVIWCIEVIGSLALASYTEDSLGSVQHNLGRILSTLDEVYEVRFLLLGRRLVLISPSLLRLWNYISNLPD